MLNKEPVTRVRLATRFPSYNFIKKEMASLLYQGEGAIFETSVMTAHSMMIKVNSSPYVTYIG